MPYNKHTRYYDILPCWYNDSQPNKWLENLLYFSLFILNSFLWKTDDRFNEKVWEQSINMHARRDVTQKAAARDT